MNKKLYKSLLILTLCAYLLTSLVFSAQAQDIISTPTPVPTSTDFLSNPDIVTFEQLNLDEIQLIGPYDSSSFSFAIPSDWKLATGTMLNLFLGVSFNSKVLDEGLDGYKYPVVLGGGTLTVLVNNVVLQVMPLDENGEFEKQISIPLDAFSRVEPNERTIVRFILDSGELCYVNDQFNMFIHKNSYLALPHESIQPDTSLVNFPRPIYQNSFKEDTAVLVVPEQPSAGELQAALTVAASLGNASQNNMLLDITKINNLASEQMQANHLIFVGKASSLPLLKDLNLPQPSLDGQFQIGDVEDGVVQMINSPWSPAHVILIVSGNTDQGTIKAAQAISTGTLFPDISPNLSVVQEVQPDPVLSSQAIERTLSDLGYDGNEFTSRGIAGSSYSFNIPLGWTTTSEAYFELVFSHSALINYDRSSITIRLNDRSIGSIRMDDISANQSPSRAKVRIPASVMRPGENQIEVRVDLIPIDDCIPPGAGGLWVSVWPESLLYLPLEQKPINSASSVNLESFPLPFTYDATLGNTAFVLPQSDTEAWRGAVQLASYLGYQAGGSLTNLSVFFGDDFPVSERELYNMLIFGRPSQMPIISEINQSLPAPFSDGSDIAADTDLQVTYRISPDSPLGYVELIPSPWNSDNVLITVMGNTAQGVSWAANSFVDPKLSGQLAGNFAVVNDQQIMTTDTQSATVLVEGVSPDTTDTTSEPALVDSATPASPSIDRPGWVLPALYSTIVVALLILAVVLFNNWSRNRALRKGKDE
jgi:hypothetical protein